MEAIDTIYFIFLLLIGGYGCISGAAEMKPRCPRCRSQWHTDCTEYGSSKLTNEDRLRIKADFEEECG